MGREAELERLRQSTVRGGLVEITGLAGVGKSRLVRVAVADDPRVALFCDVSGVQSGTELRRRLAMKLRLRSGAVSGGADPVVYALRGHEARTLVLDGAEGLHDARDEIAAMARSVPGLVVIATTSRCIGLPGGTSIDLLPLRHDVTSEEAPLTPAAELLELAVRRARRGRPLEEVERRVLPALAADLEGLPLSLVLVGALARAHTLTELRAELERGRAHTRDTAFARTLSISFALTPAAARETVRVASLFEGGITLDALATVLATTESEALSLLDELLDASWLLPLRREAASQARFKMPAAIADWVLESQDGREAGRVAAFVGYFAQHAADVLQGLRFATSAGRRWLRDERANLEVALSYATTERARCTIASALARLAYDEGLSDEYATMLNSHVGSARDNDPQQDHSIGAVALLWCALGRVADAESVLARGHASEARSFPVLVARTQLALTRGEPALAQRLASELRRTPGLTDGEAGLAVAADGAALYSVARYQDAARCFAAAEDMYLSAGLDLYSVEALAFRAFCEIELGATVEGASHAEQAGEQLLGHQHLRLAAVACMHVAMALAENGDLPGARARAERAVVLAQRAGLPARAALALFYGATIHHLERNLERACGSYEAAIAMGEDVPAARLGQLKPLIRARLAAARADLGELRVAEHHRALIDEPPGAPSTVRRAIRLHLAHLDVARARALQGPARSELIEGIRALMVGMPPPGSWDERLARRMLETEVARLVPKRLEVDLRDGVVFLPSGRRVDLTKKPIALALVAMLRNAPHVSKEALCHSVWARRAYEPSRDDPRLYMAITRLRRLLGDDPARPTLIVTTHDGYRLADEP